MSQHTNKLYLRRPRKQRYYKRAGIPTARRLMGDDAYEEQLLFHHRPAQEKNLELAGCNPEDALVELIDMKVHRKK